MSGASAAMAELPDSDLLAQQAVLEASRSSLAARQMRHLQHRARLNEEPTGVLPATLQTEREAVLRLWRTVMA